MMRSVVIVNVVRWSHGGAGCKGLVERHVVVRSVYASGLAELVIVVVRSCDADRRCWLWSTVVLGANGSVGDYRVGW